MDNLDDIISDEEWEEYFEMMDKVNTYPTKTIANSDANYYQEKNNKMEEKSSNFNTLSKGLIQGDFVFKADDYTYVERGMNTPSDGRYNVSVYEENQTDAEVKVTLLDGTITVEMPKLQIKNRNIPKYLKSTLKPHQGRISGSDGDDFRMCVIPLSNVILGKNSNARMELIIQKGAISGINFVFSDMDDNFRVYETILNLYGNLKEYI